MFRRQAIKKFLRVLETQSRLTVILILVVSALGINSRQVQALDYAWIAYNDAGWYDGQPETNITKYNISDGTTTGILRKYDDGTDTSITATFTKNGDFILTSQGSEADPGTDAYTTFNGIASTVGVIMGTTSGWWVDVEFTGLDPEKTYTFATTAIHNSSTEQNSTFTISGMESAVNSSSSGVNVLSNESVWFNSGTNKSEGYVARWTGIHPSIGGSFKVRAEGQGIEIIGYAQSVFMLAEELPPPPSVTVTVDIGQSKIYGSDDPVFTYTSSDESVEFTGALGRVAGESVGDYDITQGTLAAAGYSIEFVPASFTITKKAASVTATANGKVYGEDDPILTGTLVGFLPADNVTATYARETGETVAGSPYAISATLSPVGVLGNYEITYTEADFTITKKTASVIVAAKSKVYGDVDPVLTGALSGFLPVDNVIAAYERISGETVADSPYTISATLSPTGVLDNYDITNTSANFTITLRPVAINADDKEKYVGSDDPALTYQITSGSLAFEDEFSGELTREEGETVGTYAILQGSLVLNENYDFTYYPGLFTISDLPIVTVTADTGLSKIYGSDDPVFTYTSSDESVEFTGALGRVAGENVGDYDITQGTLAAAGYTIEFVPASFTITKKAASVTATANGKVYGEDDPILTGTLVGFLPADNVTATYARETGETVAASPYTISATLSPIVVLDNYDITNTSADFTITLRPVTVSADNKGKTVGVDDPALTFRITSGSLAFADEFSGELIRVVGESIGNYSILQNTVDLNENYNLTFIPGTFSIFELTTYNITNTYGHVVTLQAIFNPAIPNKSITFSFNGEDACSSTTNSSGYARCDTALIAEIGTFASGVMAVFSGDDNYTSASATARLIVLRRPLVVTAIGENKVYDGTTNAEVILSDNRVIGDDLSVTYTSAYFSDDANVGIDKPITVNGISVTGTDVGKYDLQNTTATTVADIIPKVITVTANSGQYKFFGQLDPVLTYTYTPSTPPITFSGSLSREPGEGIGEYDITQNTLSAGDNYSITFISAKFNILTAFRVFVPLILK